MKTAESPTSSAERESGFGLGPAKEARRVLEAQHLVRFYGKHKVVDDVNLAVRAGEVVGLLGPNGAGKTTTFYMIVGLLKPNRGKIYLGGGDITDFPLHRRARLGIGYLAQEPSIFRRMTVQENIMAILETRRLGRKERNRRCEELLAELDLTPLANRRGYQLSGGERRRVEITRALVTNPSFILLDEPFVGIDPIAVQEIQQIILRLKGRGLGILITDHSVRETLSATDRAYLMYEGKIRIGGRAQDLIEDPWARRIYLGENFRL